jgi:hypothetical protein
MDDVYKGKRPLEDNIEDESNEAKKSRLNSEIDVEFINNNEYIQYFRTGLPMIFINGRMIFFYLKEIKGVALQDATVEEITEELEKFIDEETVYITFDAVDYIKNKLIFVFGACDFNESNGILKKIYEKLDMTVKVVESINKNYIIEKKYANLIYKEELTGIRFARNSNNTIINQIFDIKHLMDRPPNKIIFITQDALYQIMRTYYRSKKKDLLKFIELANYQIFPAYMIFNKKTNKYLKNKNVTKVLGPCAYSEFRRTVHGKIQIIGIFGELHLNPSDDVKIFEPENTQRAAIFIRNVIEKNINKKYDLFVELPLLDKNDRAATNIVRKEYNSYTVCSLAIEFSKCFEIKKEDCAFKNLRGHYIDYRHEKTYKEKIEEINKEETKNYLLLNKIKNEFFRVSDGFPNLQNFFQNKINEKIKKLEKTVVSFFARLMDYYAMTRLLKSESNNNDFKENVIIYTGNAHAKTYCECLKQLKCFEVILEIKDEIEENKMVLEYNFVEFTQENKNKSFLFN